MITKVFLSVFIFLLGCSFLSAREYENDKSEPSLQAGVFKVNITPSVVVPLGGYPERNGPATGIRDELNAVAIVFDDGKTRVAIVTIDVIQVKYNEGLKIYHAIKRETGITDENIIINASHTHGSPWLEKDSLYCNEVIEKVAGAVKIALANLHPVSIGYGEGEINFNVSRRVPLADGKVVPGLNPKGITDHRVKVLRIDDANNITIPLALIFHAVCHPNVFRGENTKVTADYPGEAKNFIERNFGNETTALFLQGCAGDIRAYLPDLRKGPEYVTSFGRNGSETDMRWCGWSVGAEVVKTAVWLGVNEQMEQRQIDNTIISASDSIKVDAQKKPNASWPREHIEGGKALLPIKVLSIGKICFVALPGEPVVEYGFKIEDKLKEIGFDHVFVMGYAAADAGYIPTRKMYDEGSYEASDSAFSPDCEDHIVEKVMQLAGNLLKAKN
jgi:hypothetical protein